ALDRAFVGSVRVEDLVHDAGAARIGHELAVIADERARRRQEGEPRLAAARWAHFLQFAAALADFLDHDASVSIVDVDDDLFDRLEALAGIEIRLVDHARAPDRQLEALAPHLLDEHAQLPFAAARDLERILRLPLA